MRSSFMGLETARRGLFTQQSALYTTGHNVANANTPGYSRQRVNFQQTNAYPSIGMNSPALPGQIGTGVEGGSVQRIRETFLDVQYRTENNKVGYYGALAQSLEKMEGIMNEPSESGLQTALDQFWSALQDLTTQTENSGARDVVAARGQMVAETINYYYNTLTQVQNDIGNEVKIKVEEINALIEKIDALNRKIADVEPHGYVPNDLYDERDLLVDELSGFIHIKVTRVRPEHYGNASPLAEGLYNIEFVRKDGTSYPEPLNLVTASKETGLGPVNKLTLEPDLEAGLAPIEKIVIGGKEIEEVTSFSGELAGLIESFGYMEDKKVKGLFPEMIHKLNEMTKAFAKEFNHIHNGGYALELPSEEADGVTIEDGNYLYDFFIVTEENAAESIKVNPLIIGNSNYIKAAAARDGEKDTGSSGDNKNAHQLAAIFTKNFDAYEIFKDTTVPEELKGSLVSFYSGIIGKLGVQSQSAQKDLKNSITLAESVDMNRQSVSTVSLDEEMTNMIKYQQAYNSAARMITVMDEMLDRVVNGIGLGGR